MTVNNLSMTVNYCGILTLEIIGYFYNIDPWSQFYITFTRSNLLPFHGIAFILCYKTILMVIPLGNCHGKKFYNIDPWCQRKIQR